MYMCVCACVCVCPRVRVRCRISKDTYREGMKEEERGQRTERERAQEREIEIVGGWENRKQGEREETCRL